MSPTARRFNNSFLHQCIHSPHSIASRIAPTLRMQELGHTCLLRNLEPHRNPKPSEPVKTHHKPGTPKPSKPQPLSEPRPSEPGAILGTPEPLLTRNPFPEPGSFPEPPQLAQNTPKSILCKDPIAFCCWGKRVICNPPKFHHPHLQTSAPTPQKCSAASVFSLVGKSLRFIAQTSDSTTRQASRLRASMPTVHLPSSDAPPWPRPIARPGVDKDQEESKDCHCECGFWDQKIYLYTYTRDPKDSFFKQGIKNIK